MVLVLPEKEDQLPYSFLSLSHSFTCSPTSPCLSGFCFSPAVYHMGFRVHSNEEFHRRCATFFLHLSGPSSHPLKGHSTAEDKQEMQIGIVNGAKGAQSSPITRGALALVTFPL